MLTGLLDCHRAKASIAPFSFLLIDLVSAPNAMLGFST
jgi:hypothetical protein